MLRRFSRAECVQKTWVVTPPVLLRADCVRVSCRHFHLVVFSNRIVHRAVKKRPSEVAATSTVLSVLQCIVQVHLKWVCTAVNSPWLLILHLDGLITTKG